MSSSDAIQSVLFVSRECYVYRLPPRASSAGYKASDWQVTDHLWKGRLRVLESTPLSANGNVKSTCEIRMEDAETGELFASCPYAVDGKAVEPVLDSSRYFALAVSDPSSGKRAFLGMGFPERSEAFDFNVALQDWVRQQTPTQREKDAPAGPSPHMPADGKARDFSLKPGESIGAISFGGQKPKTTSSSLLGSGSSSGGGSILLPPPPSAKDVRRRMG